MVAGRQHPPLGLARRRAACGLRGDADATTLQVAADVLTEVRRAKSEAKRSMRAEVDTVVVHDTAERLAALARVVDDVVAAGVVTALTTTESPTFEVTVTLP